jgi:hypothetical protein
MSRSMIRLQAAFVVLATLLVCCPGYSQTEKGKDKDKKAEKKAGDNLPGKARWEWKLFDKGDRTPVESGTFMGYLDGRICHGKKQNEVGSWKWTGTDTVTATFTFPKLEGTWDLQRLKGKVPTFEGFRKGKKRLVVEILND